MLAYVAFSSLGNSGQEKDSPTAETRPEAPVILDKVTVPPEFSAPIPEDIIPNAPGATYSIADVYTDRQQGYMLIEAFGLQKHLFPGIDTSCIVVRDDNGNALLYLPVSGSGDTDGLVDENHTERVTFDAPIGGQYYFFYGCGHFPESSEIPVATLDVPGVINRHNVGSDAASDYRMVVLGKHADGRKWWYIASRAEVGNVFPRESCYYDNQNNLILGGTITFDSQLKNEILQGGFISESNFAWDSSSATPSSSIPESYQVMWANPCPLL